jgi:hypothetical protein
VTIECAAAEKSDRSYAPVDIEGLGALTSPGVESHDP